MTLSASDPRQHELVGIQCLRGIAATMVVVFHVQTQVVRMGSSAEKDPFFAAGVHIFFVISGFIMMYSARNAPSRGAGEFMLGRLIRIAPLYWLLTLALTALALLAPSMLQSAQPGLAHLAASLAFLPYRHPIVEGYFPILVAGWTLNYEMFFYAVFALGLLLTRGRPHFLAPLVCADLVLVVGAGLAFDVSGPLSFYTDPILIEFALGVLIGYWFVGGHPVPGKGAALLVAAGFTLLALGAVNQGNAPALVLYGLPSAVIVLGTVLLPPLGKVPGLRVFQAVGDASYSLYLSHGIVMSAAGQAWREAGLSGMAGRDGLFALFSVSASVLCGLALYRFVERPLTVRLKRWLSACEPASGFPSEAGSQPRSCA